jgi:hypothetical protein
MITWAILAATLLAGAEEPSSPLPGCLEPQELVTRVIQLRETKWRSWTPIVLANTWRQGLEATARAPRTNEAVGYRRPGRLIHGHLECGEHYLFEAPSSGGLREVSFSHAELSRSEAVATANLLIKAVDPPPDAGPAQKLCIDCGDPGDQLASRQWTHEGETNMLEVYLRPEVSAFVIALTWSRHRW